MTLFSEPYFRVKCIGSHGNEPANCSCFQVPVRDKNIELSPVMPPVFSVPLGEAEPEVVVAVPELGLWHQTRFFAWRSEG